MRACGGGVGVGRVGGAGSAFCRFSMQGRCGCSQSEAGRRPPPTHTHARLHTHCVFQYGPSYMISYTHLPISSPTLPLSFTPSVFSPLAVFFIQRVSSSRPPPCCKTIQHPVLCFDLNPFFPLQHPSRFCFACVCCPIFSLSWFPIFSSDNW